MVLKYSWLNYLPQIGKVSRRKCLAIDWIMYSDQNEGNLTGAAV